MPFEGTDLCVGDLEDDGSCANARRVAGSETESIFQPEWGPDGGLFFVSDRTGWSNLYVERDGEVSALTQERAEIGFPQWVFDLSRFAFLGDGRIACLVTRDAVDSLEVLAGGTLRRLELPYTHLSALRTDGSRVVVVGASPTEPSSVLEIDADTETCTVLRRSTDLTLGDELLSLPEAVTFEGAHGFYYAPKNPDFVGPDDERPPLIVYVHGGPTAHVPPILQLSVQFFTTRGLGVIDVNYGGSTGYGREYRDRLRGQWGIVDVEDSAAAASYLAERGDIDPARVEITGGSAGGYTTLLALAVRDEFAAGTSLFGVADLVTFHEDTHKFESHYDEYLVGPWPEAIEEYRERSPISHADSISRPLLLLQGLDDKVVPPAQSEVIVDALKERGIPHAYIAFAGEGHGFRKAENQKRALAAHASFLAQVFGFELADAVEPIEIENVERVVS
jgi:dipeptidyl aminopeptidase/acylaminoacyl peptidase